MPSRTRRLRRSVVLAGAAFVVVVGGGLVAWPALRGLAPFHRPGAEPPGSALETLGRYGAVPDFALTERSGRTVTRGDLVGTVWLANFIYTECTETCPLQSARVARLQTAFVGAADLRFVSITVDPEHDTPAALARYAERYGADPVRWLFLTGNKRVIYHLAKDGFRLGVVDPSDPAASAGLLRWLTPGPAWATHGSKGLIIHSARFVLVDQRAQVRAYHLPDDDASLDRLQANLRTLLRERPKAG
jgi:protein SCO1/2